MIDKMTLQYWRDQLDERWLETMAMLHKGKSVDQAVNESFGYLISDETRLQNSDISDFKRLVNGWLSNKRPDKPSPQRLKFNEL